MGETAITCSEARGKIIPLRDREYVTVPIAAEFSALSRTALYALLKSGELEGKILCGRKLISMRSLLRLLGEAPSTRREPAA